MTSMETDRHGISIGIERVEDFCYLLITATGKLTHADYVQAVPVIESAIAGVTDQRVRLLFDGCQLQGWELRAAWDDFKLGLKHGNDFEKIAIVSPKKWLKFSAKVGRWFVSGQVEPFEDVAEALAWLKQPVAGEAAA